LFEQKSPKEEAIPIQIGRAGTKAGGVTTHTLRDAVILVAVVVLTPPRR